MALKQPPVPAQTTDHRTPIKRHVFGPFGDVGYLAKKPGVVLQNVCSQERKNTIKERESLAVLERKQNDERFNQFWVHTDLKSANAKAARFVEIGMKAERRGLEHRKNLLKVRILKDESALTQEYVTKAQKCADSMFEVKQKIAEELRSKAKESQKKFVQQAYERMFWENCNELRTKQRKESLKALKNIHKRQMREKVLALNAEKGEEKIWVEFECHEDKQRSLRFEAEKSAVIKKSEDYVTSLDQQISYLNHRRRNEACIDSLEEAMRRKMVAAQEQALNTRDIGARRREEAHLKDLIQQLEANRVMGARQKEEEEQLYKMMIEADKKAAAMEQAAIVDTRAELRSELVIFNEARRQYNESMGAHEKIIDAIYEKQKVRDDLAKDAAKREKQKLKAESLKKCMDIRKRQTDEKKAREKSLKDGNLACAQLLKIQLEQNELLDASLRYSGGNTARQEVKENTEFEKYSQVLRQRERDKMDTFVKQMKTKDEEIKNKTKYLMDKPVQLTTAPMHPFLRHLLR